MPRLKSFARRIKVRDMNSEEKQLADILEQALALQKSGKAREEILAMFPEQKNELAKILAVAADLKNVNNKIVPPRALLEKIIAEINPVTSGAESRYNKQGVGRLPLKNILINKRFNLLNWRIIVPAGVLAIALAVFATAQMLPGENKPLPKIAEQAPAAVQNEPLTAIQNEPSLSAEPAINSAKTEELALALEVPEAAASETESIDSIIDSFLDDSSMEQVAAFEEDADASLLAADFQEIDNFSQSYDEKEF
jgi:hypothetical protein